MQRKIVHISGDEGPGCTLLFNGVMHRGSLSGLVLPLNPFCFSSLSPLLLLQNNLQIAGQKMAPQSSPESHPNTLCHRHQFKSNYKRQTEQGP